jgi:hypothetical protein
MWPTLKYSDENNPDLTVNTKVCDENKHRTPYIQIPFKANIPTWIVLVEKDRSQERGFNVRDFGNDWGA